MLKKYAESKVQEEEFGMNEVHRRTVFPSFKACARTEIKEAVRNEAQVPNLDSFTY